MFHLNGRSSSLRRFCRSVAKGKRLLPCQYPLDAANLEWSKLRSDRPNAATDADHHFLVDHRVQGRPDSTPDRCYSAKGGRPHVDAIVGAPQECKFSPNLVHARMNTPAMLVEDHWTPGAGSRRQSPWCNAERERVEPRYGIQLQSQIIRVSRTNDK